MDKICHRNRDERLGGKAMSIEYRSQFLTYLLKFGIAVQFEDCVEWQEIGKDFRAYFGGTGMYSRQHGNRYYLKVDSSTSEAYREFLAEVNLKKLLDKI